MDIIDLAGRTVRISKQSLTCINDETGKTAGVVRNVKRFTDLPFREQIEQMAWRKMPSKELQHLFVYDKVMYYISNTRGDDWTESKARRIENMNAAIAAGIPVIECRVESGYTINW